MLELATASDLLGVPETTLSDQPVGSRLTRPRGLESCRGEIASHVQSTSYNHAVIVFSITLVSPLVSGSSTARVHAEQSTSFATCLQTLLRMRQQQSERFSRELTIRKANVYTLTFPVAQLGEPSTSLHIVWLNGERWRGEGRGGRWRGLVGW